MESHTNTGTRAVRHILFHCLTVFLLIGWGTPDPALSDTTFESLRAKLTKRSVRKLRALRRQGRALRFGVRGPQAALESLLQAASDDTAITAAASLCASKSCWSAARTKALETLASHAIAVDGDPFSFTDCRYPDSCPDSDDPRTVWNFLRSKGILVKIERGRWVPNFRQASYYDPRSSEDYIFESMEDDWSRSHPGIPASLAVNAVKITILRQQWYHSYRPPRRGAFPVAARRPSYRPPLRGHYPLIAIVSSIATGSASETVCIAPFALPACALLDDRDGSFSSENVCSGDRIFTRADRYCADGGNCNVYPSFEYGPCGPETQATDRYRGAGFDPPYPSAIYAAGPASPDEPGRLVHYYDQTNIPDNYMGRPNAYYALRNVPEPYPRSSAGYGCASFLKPNLDAHELMTEQGEPVSYKDYHGEQVEGAWSSYSFEQYYPPFYSNQWGPADVGGEGSVADQFGVVGLPIANSQMGGFNFRPGNEADEQSARTYIKNLIGYRSIDFSNPPGPGRRRCFTASVGQLFQVLKHGARKAGEDTRIEEAIWNRITGFDGTGATETHPAALDTNIGTIDGQIIYGMINAHTPMRGHGLCRSKRMKMTLTGPTNVTFSPFGPIFTSSTNENFRADFNWGAGETTQSVLANRPWGLSSGTPVWQKLRPNFPYYNLGQDGSWLWNFKQSPLTLEGQSYGFAVVPQDGVSDETSVWKVKIPVIADPSRDAASCSSNPRSVDPVIDPNTSYEIIGFVDANIYDVDMAPLPSATASNNHGPIPQDDLIIPGNSDPMGSLALTCSQDENGCDFDYTLPELNEWRHSVYDQAGYTNAIVNPDYIDIPSGTDGSYWGPRPWFFEVDGEPTECNLTRARLACDISMIAGTENNNDRTARLIGQE